MTNKTSHWYYNCHQEISHLNQWKELSTQKPICCLAGRKMQIKAEEGKGHFKGRHWFTPVFTGNSSTIDWRWSRCLKGWWSIHGNSRSSNHQAPGTITLTESLKFLSNWYTTTEKGWKACEQGSTKIPRQFTRKQYVTHSETLQASNYQMSCGEPLIKFQGCPEVCEQGSHWQELLWGQLCLYYI